MGKDTISQKISIIWDNRSKNLSINHDPFENIKKKNKKIVLIKLYELNEVRSIPIDLNNKKDRSKLKHILAHERYRLRKRDIKKYELFLEN